MLSCCCCCLLLCCNNTQQLAAAQARKEKGNAAYKAGRIGRAVRQYAAAYDNANSINERDMAPHPVKDSAASSGSEKGAVSNAQIMAQVGIPASAAKGKMPTNMHACSSTEHMMRIVPSLFTHTHRHVHVCCVLLY